MGWRMKEAPCRSGGGGGSSHGRSAEWIFILEDAVGCGLSGEADWPSAFLRFWAILDARLGWVMTGNCVF